jgi:predicted nucleotidyltransferase
MKISLEKAIEIVREIEQNLSPFGYHCGLTGSTLYKGESEKDIDIIVYPHQVSETIPLNSVVEASGVESSMYSTNGHLKPKEISPSTTDKLVVVGTYKGYRIDLFILQ